MQIFDLVYQEVFLGKRKLREVVEEVMSLIKIRKGIAPIKPRVLIIGPRGSGRRSQALMLQDHLNIVHGDFGVFADVIVTGLLCSRFRVLAVPDVDIANTFRREI